MGTSKLLSKYLKKLLFLAAAFLIAASSLISVSADWSINYDELSGSIESITYGNGLLVAVGGRGGIIKTSTDGQNWTMRLNQGKEPDHFLDVIWSNNKFIALSSRYLYTSEDGIKWVKVSNNEPGLYSIAFNGKSYIAIGDFGFYYSKDLKSWKLVKDTQYKGVTWNKVIWGGDRFVASGNKKTAASADGIKWTECSDSLGGLWTFSDVVWTGKDYYTYIITYKEDPFKSQAVIYQSKDASKWTRYAAIDVGSQVDMGVLKYFNNTLYLTWDNKIYYSGNAKDWLQCKMEDPSAVSRKINDMAFTGTSFVAVGSSDQNILTSQDGLTWRHSSWGNNKHYLYAAANGKNIVALEKCNLYSPDSRWNIVVRRNAACETRYHIDTETDLHKIIYENEKYLVIGNNGLVLVSPDGLEWSPAAPDETEGLDIMDIIWDGKNYIATTFEGPLLKSPDGFAWESIKPSYDPMLYRMQNIAYYNGNYYRFGMEPMSRDLCIYKSGDLIKWSQSMEYEGNISAVSGTARAQVINGELVAIVDSGLILSSKDGQKWKIKSDPSDADIVQREVSQLVYNGIYYVSSVGSLDALYVSKDGLNWTSADFNTGLDILQIVSDGTNFFAVGENGLFITGTP